MKKCSNFHIRVLNMAATLLFAFVLLIGNVVSVRAYTADTSMIGYPFIFSSMIMSIADKDLNWKYYNADIGEKDAYYFDSNYSGVVTNLNFTSANDEGLVFPVNLDVYDYYLVGTLAFTNTDYADFNSLTNGFVYGFDGNNSYYSTFYLEKVPFFNEEVNGQSFYGKLDLTSNCNVNSITLGMVDDSYLFGDVWFSASIMPVAKSGTEADTLNSILQTLTQINQNVITGNTLQQQTIDAINANTNNNTNWFSTLFSNLSTWYTGMTDNLRTWLYMLDDRLNTGFSNLYNQMTKEQDEKLNGYQGTSTPDANEEFSAGSSELTEIEEQLTDVSNLNVDNYTSSAFDASIISTLGNSLVFVVTWFTNFWNMGGLFTAILNVCLAINVAFFILRIRGR